MTNNMLFYVYILRTSLNTLYIGQTNNLEKRLQEHSKKTSKSAKYMKYFASFEHVYTEIYASRQEAMQREYQLKKWKKPKKEALITGNKELLKTLSIATKIKKTRSDEKSILKQQKEKQR